MRSPILGVRGVSAGWDLHQLKAHTRLRNTSQYKVLLYLLPFGHNSNIKYDLPIQHRPIFGGEVMVGLGGRKWYQSKSRPHIPNQLIYTLHAYLAPFGHNTQRGRQTTDRVIGIGYLCYSIGALKMVPYEIMTPHSSLVGRVCLG